MILPPCWLIHVNSKTVSTDVTPSDLRPSKWVMKWLCEIGTEYHVRMLPWNTLKHWMMTIDWLIFFSSELHMDLTKYYELKQPHNSKYLMDSLGELGPTDVVGAKLDHFVAPPASCCSPVLATATSGVRRSKSPLRAQSCLSSIPTEEHSGILMTHHLLDVAPAQNGVISGLGEQLNDQHLEELYMERWVKWNSIHLWN